MCVVNTEAQGLQGCLAELRVRTSDVGLGKKEIKNTNE